MTNYLGSQPIIGNFVKLDAITVVNGQAAYTMQNGGANFVDYSSVNQFMVSLNSVIQSPGSSFTLNASTITFASNLVTNDVIDFIIVFGNSLSSGVPTDATVTAAKLNNDIISGSTELASEPADTDEFLVSDAGTLKRIDYSLIKGGGITEADQWRINADSNTGSNAFVTANWERNDTSGFSKIGTGLSESSGVFSFPSTGIYQIDFWAYLKNPGATSYAGIYLSATTDNSSYNIAAEFVTSISAANYFGGGYSSYLFDVTNTSNCKVKFTTAGANANTIYIGNTNINYTERTYLTRCDAHGPHKLTLYRCCHCSLR